MTDTSFDYRDHVVVVGYDAWTEAVVDELRTAGVEFVVVTTDRTAGERLRGQDVDSVVGDELSDALFERAGIRDATAVLVATLDDHHNVLAVLTVSDVAPAVPVTSFAADREDGAKIEQAGADTVIDLGDLVGELVVEAALTGDDIDRLLGEMVEDLTAGD